MAGGFVRHRGLIAFAAGGAMAEAMLLSFLAPSARPLAPQVTALPPLAAYHDLRWLFAFNQPWLGFTGVLLLLLLARSAVDAILIMLAWPRGDEHSLPRPRFMASLASCAVLTVLVGLVMSPVVTLMFGVALLPFSWPFLAAVPILLGTAVALSQGGVGQAWWRRLPAAGTSAWVLASFGVLSLSSALMARLDTPGVVAVAGLAGVVDARAWYGLTTAAARAAAEKPPHPWQWRATLWRIRRALRHRTYWVPMAPLAAVMVLALVVGMARLAFTGTVRFAPGPSGVTAGAVTGDDLTGPGGGASTASAKAVSGPTRVSGAVLVVEGFGSHCCRSANSLRAAEPHMVVRQFSYQGLDAAGRPIPYDLAGNMSIQVLGDRMAVQVEKLYRRAGAPVDIGAESEGTLGLYAMLARHPHLPVRSVVLLSPIVQPGQLSQAGGTVPGAALTTLNNLVGGMSPYGSSGAQELINSVSEVGGRYFERVSRDRGLSWLAVVPLADAVTLPACPMPQNVIFVDAFHGGLLGDPSVRRIVAAFLAGDTPSDQDLDAIAGGSQRDLRSAASLIAAAAAAWRMPDLHPACLSS
ncbi:MAG TPA: hypothetical protein VHS30_18400 [Streptosporangiaceae bacterium]|nr:hypothetical protein [Streptosporangiaceae bacterium]